MGAERVTRRTDAKFAPRVDVFVSAGFSARGGESREDEGGAMAGRRSDRRWPLLACSLVIAGGAAAWLFYSRHARLFGRETLPGLAAKSRVWSDGYAVPHIFATDL